MRIAAFLLITFVFAFNSVPAQDAAKLAAAKADFSKADKELNAIYQKAKTGLDSHLFQQLQTEQREWVEIRDDQASRSASFEFGAEEGAEEGHPAYWEYSTAMTGTRIQIIEGWLKIGKFEKEWEGVYLDGNGGMLAIEEKGNREFLFSFNVVRGPSYHLGEIGGTAESNGQLARFTIKAIEEDPGAPPTWIHFSKGYPKLKVSAANTMYYHGARAYFGGDYIRVGELSPENRKTIQEAIVNTTAN